MSVTKSLRKQLEYKQGIIAIQQAQLEVLQATVNELEPDAIKWRAYQARKQSLLAAGFGRSPLREEIP